MRRSLVPMRGRKMTTADTENHVWSNDLVADRTYDGKVFRMLCTIDEFAREAQAAPISTRPI